MEKDDLPPYGMTGWVEEMEYGEPLEAHGPDEVAVRVVATARGLVVYAVAERAEDARRVLLDMGFGPEQVKRMLCG